MMKVKTLFFILLFLPFVILAQGRQPRYYEVKGGDVLSKIANKNGVSQDSIIKWNNINDPNRIRQGQQIIIGWEENLVAEEPELQKKEVEEGKESHSENTSDVSFHQNTSARENPINKEDSGKYPWAQLLLGVLIGLLLGILVLGVFVFYVLYVKKLKAELKQKESELSRLSKKMSAEKPNINAELSSLRTNIQTLEQERQKLLDENVALGNEIDRLRALQSCENVNRTEETATVSARQSSTQSSGLPTTLYADAIIDDYFVKVREIPNEDSIFVLHLNSENTAEFSIHNPARQRVMINPSFLDGCKKQIVGNDMKLEIVSKGMAQKDASNGKWKVIEKLNVIIK